MPLVHTRHPLILGRLAVYAPNLHVAREVYQRVVSHDQACAFGTVTLNTGDEFDWVDMRYGIAPQDLECGPREDAPFLS